MNNNNNQSEEIVELCKARNTLQFEAIADVLEQNNFPYTYRRKGLSLGTFFEYSSKRSYIQVLVYEEDKERALELIEPILMTL
ncbi:MAG TPA: hypothetical protein ENG70_01510 [Candidatus Cloacimonetes bacterium]|nr:hypothetical protein [Candidatus Cloacimonadota bacterium]HEX37527.1 hypothetical protein [Candidatus Cloacimonadota bacterium]